jgi:hypothetical protein
MSEHEHGDEEKGHLAVPGPESHERDEALSPDELGSEDQPVPAPSEPKQPPTEPLAARSGEGGIWRRIKRALSRRS